MRNSSCTLRAAVALTLLVASASSIRAAATDPVGVIAINIAGGTESAPTMTFVSPTLTRPIVWQGNISGISANSISVSGAPLTANQFGSGYFVEVSSATKAGALSDIVANSHGSITTSDNLSTYASTGDSIRIRKHITITDFLGAANTYGLKGSNAPSKADEVLIYDGANSTSYFYHTGAAGSAAGWYNSSTLQPAGNAIIAPDVGVLIMRKAAGDVGIESTGSVKTGDTLISVRENINVLGTLAVQGLTLDNSGLYKPDNSGIKASDDPSTGDEVIIYSASGSNSYFYFTGTPGAPAGWYESSTFTAAGSVSIAAGSSFVVNRRAGGAFNWVLPLPKTF